MISLRASGVTACWLRALAALTLLTWGCGQEDDSGLHVAKVDASFGLARAERADAGKSGLADDESDSEDDSDDDSIAQTMGTSMAPEGPMVAGDGDASAGLPMSAVDAGPPARTCQNLAEFTKQVTPVVLERCVRCHDGTKGKATKAVDLTSARDPSTAAQQKACDQMLKTAPDTSDKSPIFAEVNPDDPATVHDFKYASSKEYMDYRTTVLAWLQSE